MKMLETTIDIDAPVALVWEVLTDFTAYPSWNPFVKSIEGELRKGARLKNAISLDGKKEQIFQPTIIKLEHEREFRWLGHLLVKGLFDGEHYFKLEQIRKGSTRFNHGERFTGLFVGPLMRLIGAETQQGFEAMNQALKQRVESMYDQRRA